jgi:hypothetical protein
MLLTEQELCQKLKVCRVFVYRCRKNGMPFLKLGERTYRYCYEEVLVWFHENFNGGEICKY